MSDATPSLLDLDLLRIWHPYTQAQVAPTPIEIREGRGAVLVDAQGREILDLVSSWWVNLHGHGHPALARAIGEQAARLEQVIFAGFTHAPAVQLADRLAEILPAPLARAFYSDNGSTAVEVALKAALQCRHNRGETARTRFLAFEGGYHGDTVGAMSAGASSAYFGAWASLLFPVDVLPVPATWEGDAEVEAREAEALAALDRHLEAHGACTAAAIIEPLVQGAGGMRMHRPSFLRGVVARLRAWGVLVVFDEVMTGFGRLGGLFACLETGLAPDFLCLSKGLTGGFLPMGLTFTTEEVYRAFLDERPERAFLHGHSFTANPLGCAAALASLDLLLAPSCGEARARIEAKHRGDLAPRLAASPLTTRFRVRGTLAAFDLDLPGHGYGSGLSAQLSRRFLDQGLLIRPMGPVVYLMPPYCIRDEELDRAYEGIARVLSELETRP